MKNELKEGFLNITAVISSHTVTDGHNNAHQRRNKHSSDNDGGAVHIQPDGGYKNRQHQNAHIRTLESAAGMDSFGNFFKGRKVFP